MPEAARFYGYEPNRAGFIACPFHAERTPSLKLWPERWHCFGCSAGGSVIDFVGRLYGLKPLDAVGKLDADFALGLPLGRERTRQEREEERRRRHEAEVRRQFEEWRGETLDRLCAALLVRNLALRRAMDTWSSRETEAVRRGETLEYWADILENGDLEAQMEIFRERKGVEKRCGMILGDSQGKWRTA